MSRLCFSITKRLHCQDRCFEWKSIKESNQTGQASISADTRLVVPPLSGRESFHGLYRCVSGQVAGSRGVQLSEVRSALPRLRPRLAGSSSFGVPPARLEGDGLIPRRPPANPLPRGSASSTVCVAAGWHCRGRCTGCGMVSRLCHFVRLAPILHPQSLQTLCQNPTAPTRNPARFFAPFAIYVR